MITEADWLKECARRIKQYEALRLYKYRDSNGIPTLGYGYNLANGLGAWMKIGANIADIQDAPTAKSPAIEDAVAPCITKAQADAVFALILPKYVAEARASLPSSVFDMLDDARRFCVLDLTYNMGAGEDGWGGFHATHALLRQAVDAKTQGRMEEAHALFGEAADHLEASAWFRQTGERAVNDVAMMRTSQWVPPISYPD